MDGITGTTVAAIIVAITPAVLADATAIITGTIGTTVAAITDAATGGRDH